MKFFIDLLIKLCEKLGRVQHVYGRTKAEIYMCRYILFRSEIFTIYLHQFLRSDQDSYHDHPWNFWTYVVSGAYCEHKPYDQKKPLVKDTIFNRTVTQNRLVHRKAEELHWVEIDRTYSYDERFSAPTTICFIGRRKRVWGFIDKSNGNWVFWKQYLGLPFTQDELLKSRPSSEG